MARYRPIMVPLTQERLAAMAIELADKQDGAQAGTKFEWSMTATRFDGSDTDTDRVTDFAVGFRLATNAEQYDAGVEGVVDPDFDPDIDPDFDHENTEEGEGEDGIDGGPVDE